MTPSLIVPKRTGEFSFVRATKIGFPQKRLFVSRSCGLVCLFLFSVLIYLFFYSFFPYLLAVVVWLSSTLHYKTVFSFSKTFSKKIFWNVLKNRFSRYGTHAREVCFQTIENQCFIKKQKIFFSLQKSKKHRFNACNNLKSCINDCFTDCCRFNLILIRYLMEKYFFRLSICKHQKQKGLFWFTFG